MLVLLKINSCCTRALLRVTLEDRGEGIPPSTWDFEQCTWRFTFSGGIKVLRYEYT